jgi:hypothetical protein
MGSLCKKILKYGLVAFGTYAGIKLYSIGKAIVRVSKTLPEFVKNLYGEKPKFTLDSKNIINIQIKLGFPKNVVENNDDIQETVIEYIQDFYPALSNCKVNVEIYELDATDDNSEEADEIVNEDNLPEDNSEEAEEIVKEDNLSEEEVVKEDENSNEDIDSNEKKE